MLILSATNLEANCSVKAIAIADNMIYLLRVRKAPGMHDGLESSLADEGGPAG